MKEKTMKSPFWGLTCLFVIYLFLSGCQNVEHTNQTQMAATQAPPPTVQFGLTPSPALIVTQTVAPTINPFQVDIIHPDILLSPPPDMEIDGTGIVAETIQLSVQAAYLIDWITGEMLALPSSVSTPHNFEAFQVSPDYRYISYVSEFYTQIPENQYLFIVDSHGEIIVKQWIDRGDWQFIDGWLNNETLIISRWKCIFDSEGRCVHFDPPLPEILFDITTREVDERNETYSDMVITFPEISWQDYGLTERGYDPTMSYVVYPRDDGAVVLWDIEENKEIMHFQPNKGAYFGDGPSWYIDGSRFMIDQVNGEDAYSDAKGNREDLSLVFQDGRIERLTYLKDIYEYSNIINYHWSPDGRYIAFITGISPDPCGGQGGDYQAVLDTSTSEMSLFCFEVSPGQYSFNSIWSPDGKQLLTSYYTYTEEEGESVSTLIIDLEKGYVVKMIDDMVPLGWLTDAP